MPLRWGLDRENTAEDTQPEHLVSVITISSLTNHDASGLTETFYEFNKFFAVMYFRIIHN
jgi:hypothetical protein